MEKKTDQLTVLTKNVNKETAVALRKAFEPYLVKAKGWEKEAKKIVVKDISQVEYMKKAKEYRLQIKKVRVAVEHKRKELKEESLKTGQTIDGLAKLFKDMVEPIEVHLKTQEDFAVNELRLKREKRESDRKLELSKYDDDGSAVDLYNITDEVYKEYLKKVKLAHKTEQDRLKQEEEDRLAEKKKQAEEKIEAERLIERNNQRALDASGIGLLWNHDNQSFTFENINISIIEVQTDSDDVFQKKLSKYKEIIDFRKKAIKQIEEENQRLQKELDQKQLESDKKEEQIQEEPELRAEQMINSNECYLSDEEKLKQLKEDIKNIKLPDMASVPGAEIVFNVRGLLKKVEGFIIKRMSELDV